MNPNKILDCNATVERNNYSDQPQFVRDHQRAAVAVIADLSHARGPEKPEGAENFLHNFTICSL